MDVISFSGLVNDVGFLTYFGGSFLTEFLFKTFACGIIAFIFGAECMIVFSRGLCLRFLNRGLSDLDVLTVLTSPESCFGSLVWFGLLNFSFCFDFWDQYCKTVNFDRPPCFPKLCIRHMWFESKVIS